MKKIISFLIILGLAGGGFFYWWQNQADVRALNKTLPDGVRVEKSLFGEEYRVVNKIDGYEFKVPKEWEGLEEIIYTPERTEGDYTGTSLNLGGKQGGNTILYVDLFSSDGDINLETWARDAFNAFGLVGNFNKDRIHNIDVITTQEELHLMGMYVYFFESENGIYSITNGSQEFIKYIIANGQW